MDLNRKHWNDQQRELQQALRHLSDRQKVIDLFLDHHAMVHSASIAETGLWSLEGEVLDGLEEAKFRCIPAKEEHSIAWILWHLARIEDVAMNMLVAGSPQVFASGNWLERMGFNSSGTGNELDKAGIILLSETIKMDELQAYRNAVGRRTRIIVNDLKLGDFKEKVDPKRLEKLHVEDVIVKSTLWLSDYWSKKTIAGLLLMPPTRHNFVHLNEAARIRQKL
jgi:hypothetical protein